MESDSVNILIVAPLQAYSIEEITTISRTKHIMTFSSVPEYVNEGLSVGIGLKGGKPQILINLDAAKLEGLDFSSQLLKLAKIIQE